MYRFGSVREGPAGSGRVRQGPRESGGVRKGPGGSWRVREGAEGCTRAQSGTIVCGMEWKGGCVRYGRVRHGTGESRGCQRVKEGAER